MKTVAVIHYANGAVTVHRYPVDRSDAAGFVERQLDRLGDTTSKHGRIRAVTLQFRNDDEPDGPVDIEVPQ